MSVPRFLITAVLVVFAAGPRRAAALAPEQRPSRLYTIEELLDTTEVFGPSFSADGSRVLFTSDRTGIFNVYTVPSAGGEPAPVTRSTTESTFGVGFFPRDDRILFTHDQGGNENNHLYVIADGQERDLTPGKSHKAMFLKWSHDGSGLYYMSNERNPKFMDLYRLETDGYARTLIYQDDVGYQIGDISE